MSSDRSVSTDALASLGMLAPEGSGRDAIHLAVEPIVAIVRVFPGQHVDSSGTPVGAKVGIVDPYLTVAVEPGQRFWLFVYPRQITSLRHVWSHPAFPEEAASPEAAVAASKAASEQWIRDFAERSDCPGYHALMASAEYHCENVSDDEWNSSYLHFDGQSAHGQIPAEFWEHFERVTGKSVQGPRPSYFSCSC